MKENGDSLRVFRGFSLKLVNFFSWFRLTDWFSVSLLFSTDIFIL